MSGFPGNEGNGPDCESNDKEHWERYQFAERIAVLRMHDETRVKEISHPVSAYMGPS